MLLAYSSDFLAGFEKAKEMALTCVKQARFGEADSDLRSVINRIKGLTPDSDLTPEH